MAEEEQEEEENKLLRPREQKLAVKKFLKMINELRLDSLAIKSPRTTMWLYYLILFF